MTPLDPPDHRTFPYYRRVLRRVAGDAFFLARVDTVGYEQAIRETCEMVSHDARGGRCERCGNWLTAAEARAGRERQRPASAA